MPCCLCSWPWRRSSAGGGRGSRREKVGARATHFIALRPDADVARAAEALQEALVAGAEEGVRRELSGCMVSKERLHVTLLPLRLGESELEAACARLDAVASKVTGGGWNMLRQRKALLQLMEECVTMEFDYLSRRSRFPLQAEGP